MAAGGAGSPGSLAGRKPAIFISHSTRDPAGVELLDRLEAELTRAGFDVLLDRKRLGPGYEWESQLHDWIARCHGAVILFSSRVFSEGAVKSNWVLKEATLLAWRKSLDERFLLVPVLLPGATAQSFREGPFEPLGLAAIQGIANADPQSLPGQIAGVLAPLQGQRIDTPMELLEAKIAQALRDLRPDLLDYLAQVAGIDVSRWDPAVDRPRRVAAGLLSVGIDKLPAIMSVLTPDTLRRQSAEMILNVLAPAWVEQEGATMLGVVARRANGSRAAMLNACSEMAAAHYVARACLRYPPWYRVPLANCGGEQASGALFREALDTLKPLLGLRGSDEWIVETLKRDRVPIFLVIGPPLPQPQALERLRQELPRCTILLLAGDRPPENLGPQFSFVERLTPEIPAGAEERAVDVFIAARQYLGSPGEG